LHCSFTESALAKTPWTCKTRQTVFTRRKIHRQVEHRLPTGAAWERTYEREIRKKEKWKVAMAAVVAVADVTTACWGRGRAAHRRRGVHRGTHERLPLPSGGYPPTGG